MNESTTIKIPKEAFEHELKYMQAVTRHVQDFDRLLHFVPETQTGVREAIQSCYYTEPDRLLDSEKLEKLKDENKQMWEKVVGFYTGFLNKELGFE